MATIITRHWTMEQIRIFKIRKYNIKLLNFMLSEMQIFLQFELRIIKMEGTFSPHFSPRRSRLLIMSLQFPMWNIARKHVFENSSQSFTKKVTNVKRGERNEKVEKELVFVWLMIMSSIRCERLNALSAEIINYLINRRNGEYRYQRVLG